MATLINAAMHWDDESSLGSSAHELKLMQVGSGQFTFATRGARVAGSLVARDGGGYVVARGSTTGTGAAVRVADASVVIF